MTADAVLLAPNPHEAANALAVQIVLTVDRAARLYVFADGSRVGEVDAIGAPESVTAVDGDPSAWAGSSGYVYDTY